MYRAFVPTIWHCLAGSILALSLAGYAVVKFPRLFLPALTNSYAIDPASPTPTKGNGPRRSH